MRSDAWKVGAASCSGCGGCRDEPSLGVGIQLRSRLSSPSRLHTDWCPAQSLTPRGCCAHRAERMLGEWTVETERNSWLSFTDPLCPPQWQALH